MNMGLRSVLPVWRFGVVLAVAGVAIGQSANAATKTVTFDWEDGTSTSTFHVVSPTGNDLPPVKITPDSSDIATANVTSGSIIDYGPKAAPFATPLTIPVTPFAGSHMLEVSLTPGIIDNGVDGFVYLGVLTGLNDGDTYQFSFHAYDPTDGRSPTRPPDATFANTADLDTRDGYTVPSQTFLTGSGWLNTPLDVDGNANTHVDPVVTFHPAASTSHLANAVRLTADIFYQSQTQTNGGVEKMYLDDMSITVTSSNPDAAIFLPDGSKVLVNPPGVTGDYDGTGVVDAADYTVWRDHLGQTTADGYTLPNDGGISSGVVDTDDYNYWVSRFGSTSGGAGSLDGGAVPEPGSIALLAVGVIGLFAGRSRFGR
jgi:hypothetical protein